MNELNCFDRLFQPTLISNKKNNLKTFDNLKERIAKSVETFHLRRSIAKANESPGPGYYGQINLDFHSLLPNNINDKKHLVRNRSPGSNGFYFSKESRGFHNNTTSNKTLISTISSNIIGPYGYVGGYKNMS